MQRRQKRRHKKFPMLSGNFKRSNNKKAYSESGSNLDLQQMWKVW
jgi:hypothetical protein